MPDKNSPASLKRPHEPLAREIGAMDHDDPRWIELIDEMSALTVNNAELKLKN